MMHLHYIYSIDKEGYLTDHKMQCEVEKMPAVGDKLTTFYNEEVTFYNLAGTVDEAGNSLLILDGKLQAFDKVQAFEKTKELLVKFVHLVNNVECTDLTGHVAGFPSHLDDIHYVLKELKLETPTDKKQFNVQEYLDVEKDLLMYSYLNSAHIYMVINRLVSGVNTLLAMDEIIPSSPNNRHFSTDFDEETNENYLSYSKAADDFRYSRDFVYNLNSFVHEKKLKMK